MKHWCEPQEDVVGFAEVEGNRTATDRGHELEAEQVPRLRQTSRANAGRPPERWGCPEPVRRRLE